MGIFKKFIKSQFIEVIEWTTNDDSKLVYRFPVEGNEIKMGAELIVRSSQVAILINEGVLADVFEPGRYQLETGNMPILTKLKSWKYGFNSPFKAEVYFVSTKQFTNMKWGTKNPVMMRDQEFGRVRIRALGVYAFRVLNAKKFLHEIFGTSGDFRSDKIQDYLRGIVVSSLSDLFAESNIAVMDFTQNLDELGINGKAKLKPLFEEIGFEITNFVIENISLPEDVMEAMDERNKMAMLGVSSYTTYKAANAMGDAANNPNGGLAGAGVGLGAGAAIGNMMSEAMSAKTINCTNCNSSINETSKFCPNCGKSTHVEQKKCIKCNAVINMNSKFCPECGETQSNAIECTNCGAKVSGTFCADCGTKVK